ncbi:MAG: hypothetical protein KF752_15175 [Pirellulaceae bacterium]|nr:hypothetical protein [Pirellulaceae bacterium]
MTNRWLTRLVWVASTALVLWLASTPGNLLSQTAIVPSRAEGGGRLQMHSSQTAQGTQLIILDDSVRSLAVYQVDGGGNLQLRCVRALSGDLRMEEYNGSPPLPSEIRRAQP